MAMFTMIHEGKHGETVTVDNPKIEAYKQAAYVSGVLGRLYSLVFHEDGAITVQGAGLAPLTFEREV